MLSGELSFLHLEPDSCFVKKAQCSANMFHVVRERLSKYDNVVRVHDGELPLYRGKDKVCCSLKGCRGVHQPELHSKKRTEALVGSKRSFVPVELINFDLPIP